MVLQKRLILVSKKIKGKRRKTKEKKRSKRKSTSESRLEHPETSNVESFLQLLTMSPTPLTLVHHRIYNSIIKEERRIKEKQQQKEKEERKNKKMKKRIPKYLRLVHC